MPPHPWAPVSSAGAVRRCACVVRATRAAGGAQSWLFSRSDGDVWDLVQEKIVASTLQSRWMAMCSLESPQCWEMLCIMFLQRVDTAKCRKREMKVPNSGRGTTDKKGQSWEATCAWNSQESSEGRFPLCANRRGTLGPQGGRGPGPVWVRKLCSSLPRFCGGTLGCLCPLTGPCSALSPVLCTDMKQVHGRTGSLGTRLWGRVRLALVLSLLDSPEGMLSLGEWMPQGRRSCASPRHHAWRPGQPREKVSMGNKVNGN